MQRILSASTRAMRTGLVLLAAVVLTGCGYNDFQRLDEQTKAAWSEVLNQYQRRADLIPNLVETVRGFARQEREVLIGVTEARDKVGAVQVTPEVLDSPQAFAQFQAAQGELSSALSRLMVVVERYPELKSTEGFRDLQAQLEGTENRIAVARKRYIESVSEYNKTVQRFPSSIGASMRSKSVRPTFEGAPGAEKPPEVKF